MSISEIAQEIVVIGIENLSLTVQSGALSISSERTCLRRPADPDISLHP
jgi:hypothetical protein